PAAADPYQCIILCTDRGIYDIIPLYFSKLPEDIPILSVPKIWKAFPLWYGCLSYQVPEIHNPVPESFRKKVRTPVLHGSPSPPAWSGTSSHKYLPYKDEV